MNGYTLKDPLKKTRYEKNLEARETEMHRAIERAIDTEDPVWLGHYMHPEKGAVPVYITAKVDD